jgi:3-oxoacyl-[acyl-carrier-protein] synthase I
MTSPRSALTVVASGMVTGLGYNARATLAALRAGVSGVRSATWPDFESGQQVRCARVSFPQRHAGTALLADLVTPAIDECLSAAASPGSSHVPLLIGVSRLDRPGRPPDVEQRLLQHVYARLEATPCRDSKIFSADQAGCAFALIEARRLLDVGAATEVIIAGVDTLLDRTFINAYTARRRLLTPANFNGFLPGEGGTAVLVQSKRDAVGLRLLGIGQAQESATIEQNKPLRGNGLTSAIRAALSTAGVAMSSVSFRVTDLSGEHYKFKEAMFALIRLDQTPRDVPLAMWHPIEFVGEIGAAILPCLLGWTLDALRRGYAPGPLALCHLGSDDGHRFAIVAGGA